MKKYYYTYNYNTKVTYHFHLELNFSSLPIAFNCEEGKVRLLDGANNSSGRIEYCKHGTWGSVCSDGWGDRDARVVCRQLGFNPAGMQYNHSF